MKILTRLLRISLTISLTVFFSTNVNGQFLKKLGKKAERAAERTIERRVERETSKKTDAALDSILEPGSKQPSNTPNSNGGSSPPSNDNGSNSGGQNGGTAGGPSGQKTITVYSKFDFVPGDELLFFDDYANDFIGDFPSKWNTNGSGEVVTVDDSPQRWMQILPGYKTFYVPDVPKLPEEYTIEFDLLAVGLDNKTSSTATMEVLLSDDLNFQYGDNYVEAHIPFCQYSAIGIRMRNYINRGKEGEINNVVKADLRNAVLNQPHISIAVNKQRFRLWVNEKKYVDIPRAVPTGKLSTLKFQLSNFKDGKERLFLSNLKVAKGGLDLRRTLISTGKVSTNGILFDVGSANIQPQSMGIIRQISQVLQQESSMNLRIVGHTDADGNDAANMELSKKRAAAVKNALVSVYNVSSSRLETEGKGETMPVGDNGTADGKAQNRRVEFIKI
ncbi:OmpA family protein [Spongiimicrobium sp. 3-5]|uniref:OmpA family protein n=1 Tax=Spongiimicrobium sp. 3-5 TaxID=3332596 RepID=UPI00397F5B4A